MDAMNKFKWTKKEGLSFNKLVLSLPVNVRCSKTDNAEWSVSPSFILREPGCHSWPESHRGKSRLQIVIHCSAVWVSFPA